MDNKRTGTLYCGKIWISKLYLKKFSRKKKTLFRWITHNFDARHHPLFVSPFHVHKRFFFLKKRPNCYTFFPLSKGYADNHFRLLLYCIFSNNVVYDLHVNFMHTWQKFPKITIRNDQKKKESISQCNSLQRFLFKWKEK